MGKIHEKSNIFEKIHHFLHLKSFLSYELVKQTLSKHHKKFEKSSEFSQPIALEWKIFLEIPNPQPNAFMRNSMVIRKIDFDKPMTD